MQLQTQPRSFFRNVLTLVSANVAVQAINIAVLPVLTRLYTPDDFGVAAFYVTMLTVLTLFTTARLDAAIIPAASGSEAAQIVWSVAWLSLSGAAVVAAAALVAALVAGNVAGLLPMYMALAAVHIFVTGLNLGLYALLNRIEAYPVLSQGRIAGAVALAMTSLGAGVASLGAPGLILGTIVGMTINVAWMYRAARCRDLLGAPIAAAVLINTLRRNWDFPRYLIPSGLLERVSSQLHLLVYAPVFGPSAAGAIGLYDRVVSMPTGLVARAVGDVFRQRANAEIATRGECRTLFISTALRLALLAVGPFLVLLLGGPTLFAFVFGDSWRQAGEFAQILSPVFLVGFVISPLSALFFLAGNQRYDLYLQGYLLLAVGASMAAAVLLHDARVGLSAFAVAYVSKYLIEGRIAYAIAGGRPLRRAS